MAENGASNRVTDPLVPAEEGKTIKVMISLYCRDHHQCEFPCEQCRELLEYAIERVKQCPLQEKRTTCGKCKVHCYKPSMQKKIKEVMRYAGPKMLKAHPILAAKHMLKALAKR